jgi:thymidylate synthase
MKSYEADYAKLVANILDRGEVRETRNATTKALFGTAFEVDMSNLASPNEGYFPLLQGRKMYYRGVLGEFAAMIRGPKSLKDFERQGCNYWKQWADDEGNLEVDYGNAWIDYDGYDQIEELRHLLKTNPSDRRMLVTGWRPDRLDRLSLPCCHLLYQWFVRDNMFLDMLWYQRSADTMVGIPSDVVLAATWNIALAKDVGLRPGKITMVFGDTHIYEPHWALAESYLEEFYGMSEKPLPSYCHVPNKGKHVKDMEVNDFVINYKPGPVMRFEVLA